MGVSPFQGEPARGTPGSSLRIGRAKFATIQKIRGFCQAASYHSSRTRSGVVTLEDRSLMLRKTLTGVGGISGRRFPCGRPDASEMGRAEPWGDRQSRDNLWINPSLTKV